MRILYLGDDFIQSTSAHRSAALVRLGHNVITINPRSFMPPHRMISALNVRTGFRLFASWVGFRVRSAIKERLYEAGWPSLDLVWVDGCPELPPDFFRWVKDQDYRVLNYIIDDPFGGRDRRKWDLWVKSLRHHDLTVVVRVQNIEEARRRGAKRVVRVLMSCDPQAHAPITLTDTDRDKWASEVAFIGTWMPERGPFLQRLLELGVPLSIWGDRWHKAPEWPQLQASWRGPAIYGSDYVKAVQCAKVIIGLLSVGNRDLSTTRSAEVPFIGGAVFCAQRTPEHEAMLKDGFEAFFWSTSDECARLAISLLADPDLRHRLAAAAQQRIRRDNVTNDAVLRYCLNSLQAV